MKYVYNVVIYGNAYTLSNSLKSRFCHVHQVILVVIGLVKYCIYKKI